MNYGKYKRKRTGDSKVKSKRKRTPIWQGKKKIAFEGKKESILNEGQRSSGEEEREKLAKIRGKIKLRREIKQ